MEFHDDGRLTAEQIDKLLEAVGEDDADADAKTEAADSESEKKPEQEPASEPDESKLDPSNAVILGKDGKSTFALTLAGVFLVPLGMFMGLFF
jgi:hypothetical protein